MMNPKKVSAVFGIDFDADGVRCEWLVNRISLPDPNLSGVGANKKGTCVPFFLSCPAMKHR